jgi:outer membrane protein assembly factor BamB
MKTKLFLVIAFFSMQSYAQISKIEGINKFKLRNSGVILDKNKDADGYYFFYVVDKLKKGNSEFAIQILDKNLNEVAKKTYVENKNTFLMSSSFNNQALMFAMANFVQEKIELLSFDKQANQQKTVSIPLEKKEIRYLQMAMQQTSEFNVLFPVENKGFIFNKFEDNKKIGYSLKYYPTDGGKAWEYSSPDESKEILAINPIEVNDKILVAIETSRPVYCQEK